MNGLILQFAYTYTDNNRPKLNGFSEMRELDKRGTPRPYEEVLREMQERDWADSHREIAPLREAEDAIRVDTSDLNFEESRQALLDVIRRRLEEE